VLTRHSIVHFANREGTGVGIVLDPGGWPVIRLANGAQTALNPAMNTIRPATAAEQAAYHVEASESPY
jgi:hypothetical protein